MKLQAIIKTDNYNQKLHEEIRKMGLSLRQVLIVSVVGSQLYGTDTPESDVDYRGVFVPTKEQIILSDFPHTINAPKSSGLDFQMWSIHHLFKLLYGGETMALDLLHAPPEMWNIYNDDIWGYLFNNRTSFYTKQMRAFVGYARKQAAKYGIKGTRIEAYEDVIHFLEMYAPYNGKLMDVWDKLPAENEHIHFLDTEPFKMYQVCGKKYQETVKVNYALEHLRKSLTEYGGRAMLARQNEGVDWKAVSHAIRAAMQVYDILNTGIYILPLTNGDYIRDIKLGKIDFNEVQEILEDYMERIERMLPNSSLADEVNKNFWNKWIINIFEQYILKG